MDNVFRALADPSRRRLLDSLNTRNGQTLRELCSGLDMARQSVSKHLAILEGANLVTTVRHGREKLHYLNAAPIAELADRWISRYDQQRIDALADLKRALEGTPVSKPEFVYTTYIHTTAEMLWRALTEPAFTRRYWSGTELATTWKPGATMTWQLPHGGPSIVDPDQVLLESEPYRRLSYTWHSFTPEWAAAYNISDEQRERFAAEPRSKVTFTLEPQGDQVRLTVVHDNFQPGSSVLDGVREGWPQILAELKTLLEAPERASA